MQFQQVSSSFPASPKEWVTHQGFERWHLGQGWTQHFSSSAPDSLTDHVPFGGRQVKLTEAEWLLLNLGIRHPPVLSLLLWHQAEVFLREQDTKLINVKLKPPQQSNFINYENWKSSGMLLLSRWSLWWTRTWLLSLSLSHLFCSHPKVWLVFANNIKHIHLFNVLPTHCTTGWKLWNKLWQFQTKFHIRQPTDFSFPPLLTDHRSLSFSALSLPHRIFFHQW